MVASGVVWWTLLARGDPGQPRGFVRGDLSFYRDGGMVNGGGFQPPSIFKSMGGQHKDKLSAAYRLIF